MRNILIVVDMQKDFVTGALASAEAQAILPEVKAKISEYDRAERPRRVHSSKIPAVVLVSVRFSFCNHHLVALF